MRVEIELGRNGLILRRIPFPNGKEWRFDQKHETPTFHVPLTPEQQKDFKERFILRRTTTSTT